MSKISKSSKLMGNYMIKKMLKATSILLTPILVLSLQLGTFAPANADPIGFTNLSIQGSIFFSNTTYEAEVCNQGTDEVTKFVLSHTFVNFPLSESLIDVANSNIRGGSTIGAYDPNTDTWSGSLLQSDCIRIMYHGTPAPGSNVSLDSSIASSELTAGAINNDPDNSNDIADNISFVKDENSDLDIETRLLTQGTISPTTTIEYEATIKSIGPGAYVDNGFFILAFIMPPDASFIGVTDVNTGDVVDVQGNCNNMGPIANLGFSALSSYTGDVVACFLSANSDLPAGSEYKFNLSLTAGDSFANGDAEVIAIIEGNDIDTYEIFKSLALGTNPLALNTGNFKYLAYDPSVLKATSSLCPGQGETTSDGTGCFRISFNKDIYEPSFGLEDIVITGSGTPSSLTKVDGEEGVWEVRITGITSGTASTISLNLGGILDYNSIGSQAKVLGINTIRFADTPAPTPSGETGSVAGTTPGKTSANGTLAVTGYSSSDFYASLTLILMGLVLVGISKRRFAKQAKN